MEFVGEPRPSGDFNLLAVPCLGFGDVDVDVDDEEGEVVISIRPKSSPLPRRKTSISSSDDDSDPDPARCGSRRVSFADAKGLHLVRVKEFDVWDTPKVPGCNDSMQSEGNQAGDYYNLSPQFSSPLPLEELFKRVREQKVELGAIDLLPGTTTLKGLIRVLNVSYDKMVYIRTSLDAWASHFDLLAEYLPSFSDGVTDCFSFKLTLVPPFGEQGARVDFCLRYETPIGTFWANNNGQNYTVFCHQRPKTQKEKPQKVNVCMKSCLKAVGQNFTMEDEASQENLPYWENVSTGVLKHGKSAAVKVQQISDSPSGTSEEDRQKLPVDSSQRRKRQAARLAQVRHYFAQRDEKPTDGEREVSVSEMPPTATRDNPPLEKSNISKTHPLSVAHGQLEGSGVISEPPPTSIKPSPEVQYEIPPTQDGTSNDKSEKSESVDVGVISGIIEKQSTVIPNSLPLPHDESAPPNHLNANSSLSRNEGKSLRKMVSDDGGMNDESLTNAEQESDTNVCSVERSEGLIGSASSFTFGTVVAPLYHQVFGMVGAEGQISDDSLQSNSTGGKLNMRNLSTSYCPPAVTRENSFNIPADTRRNHTEIGKDQAEILPSNQGHKDTWEEPEPSLHISDSDASTAQIPRESLDLQGEVLEASLVHDPPYGVLVQKQLMTETAHTHPAEKTTSQIEIFHHVPLSLTQIDTTSFFNPELSPIASVNTSAEMELPTSRGEAAACEHVSELNNTDDTRTLTPSITNAFLNQEESEFPYDLDSSCVMDSTTIELDNISTEDQNVSVVSFETAKNKCSMGEDISEIPKTFPETPNSMGERNEVTSNLGKEKTMLSAENEDSVEVSESNLAVIKKSCHKNSDMFVAFKDEDTLEGVQKENTSISEKEEEDEEDSEIKITVAKLEVSPEKTAEERDWEMMVEEEEVDVFRNEEISEEKNKKEKNTEEVELETGVHLEELEEGKGFEVEMEAIEATNMTEKDERVEQMVRENDDVEMENEEEMTEEQTLAMEEKNVEELEKEELVDIIRTQEEESIEEAEIVENILQKEGEYEEELEDDIRGAENLEEEGEVEREEEMETDKREDEDEEKETGSVCEAEIQLQDEKLEKEEEEEIPDYKEMMAKEAGDEEITEEEVKEEKENESRGLDESFDNDNNNPNPYKMLNAAEDNFSTPANSLQAAAGERDTNAETMEGNAYNSAEMYFHAEGGTQSKNEAEHEQSMAIRISDGDENSVSEQSLCFLEDKPVGDQTGEESDSTESLSDDEVELHMRCLRAAHRKNPGQAIKDISKGLGGGNMGKRPSIARGKQLPLPMPSIDESLDEEQPTCILQDHQEDTQPTVEPLPSVEEQKSVSRHVARWRQTLTRINIMQTLLYSTLVAVFLFVAYHYDFLACFALYLISAFWLCFRGDKQPPKSNNRVG